MTRTCAVTLTCLFFVACGGPDATDPVDLMDTPHVVIAPVDEVEMPPRIMLGGEIRHALAASLPSEFRYRIRVPERALLTFAVGIVTAPDSSPDDPVPGDRVRFAVRAGEDAADTLVFDRQIHVARRGQWIEQQIDLASVAGREVWLVFQSSVPGADETENVPVVGVFGEPVLHDRARYRDGRGLVIVSIDTLRRDHTSVYGYPRRTTPGLEALATESVVFEDAVSTSSWTLPAHASLLTSTYPSVHGAVNLNRGLSPGWPNLASILQGTGFTTRAIVSHVYLSRAYGFGEGFDRHQYLEEARAEEITDRAIQSLTSMGDRDFFLFVHYYDPHWHYDPPAPYDRMFDRSYGGDVSGIWWDFKELDAESIEPRDLHHILALYDGEIRYTDHHVERLLREMKRIGVFDKSLIVVTSDHGEEFLEHGSWEHQKTLFEEQLRIPLLVKFPGSERGGTRVTGQVSLIDVAPTVLDTMGISVPDSFRGMSLRDVDPSRREVWAETEHTIDGSHKLALRRGVGQTKAIFSRFPEDSRDLRLQLFDLRQDPSELVDIDDEGERRAFEQRMSEYLSGAAKARAGQPESPTVVLEPKERERLRALGYIQN